MPFDKIGKFHSGTQRAMASDRMHTGIPKESRGARALEAPGELPGEESAEPPSPVHEHLQALHAQMGGKHFHAHDDGMSVTSHHVGEDGQVQGPHEHNTAEEAAQAMDAFFREEAQEPQHSAEHGMASGSLKGVY